MTYTSLAVLGVLVAVVVDRWVARTRITSTRDWWCAYAIIVFFQLLTNGWLTGRRIVQYDPGTILGSEQVVARAPRAGDPRAVGRVDGIPGRSLTRLAPAVPAHEQRAPLELRARLLDGPGDGTGDPRRLEVVA